MRYKFFQYPRGVNKGGVLNTEICPTISTSSWENNCFLIEIYDGQEADDPTPKSGGGISRTVKTDDSLAVMEEIIKVGNYPPSGHNASSVVSGEGLAPTVMENHGTVTAVMEENIVEPLNTDIDAALAPSKHNTTRMGATSVVQIGNIYPDTDNFKNRTSGRVNSAEGLSPTLRTVTGGHNEPKVVEQKQPRYRIRKLTPRECFRLMDVDDADIDKIQAAGISNSQQYKLAGNSIVVNVLYHLFRKMFVETENESQQLTLF